MSDKHSWCHGPDCHTKKTQDRIRGVKGNKVLRTRRVRWYQSSYESKWNYFCSQHCMTDYIDKYLRQFIAIAPRPEPLETNINLTERKVQSTRYNWGTETSEPYTYIEKNIEVLDNRNE